MPNITMLACCCDPSVSLSSGSSDGLDPCLRWKRDPLVLVLALVLVVGWNIGKIAHATLAPEALALGNITNPWNSLLAWISYLGFS